MRTRCFLFKAKKIQALSGLPRAKKRRQTPVQKLPASGLIMLFGYQYIIKLANCILLLPVSGVLVVLR